MRRRTLSVRDLDVAGKRVFVRVDFNVPLEGGRVADDTRVRASLPTIDLIRGRGGRVVAASHLGRPKGRPVPSMGLRPVAVRLEEILKAKVQMAEDCVGPAAEAASRALQDGEVLLLENLRFHPEEEKNDAGFAARLAALGDCYVNDAFGSAHRAHASVAAITRHLPAAAGLLMDREIEMLSRLRDAPGKPYVAILGGAKVSDKIELIESLLQSVDAILIGGAMAYTFLKAEGTPVGGSRVEEGHLDAARAITARARAASVRILLPSDHVVAASPDPGAESRTTPGAEIPSGLVGLDIGPRSRSMFAEALRQAATIFWNGPVGLFEVPPYDAGTLAVASAIAATSAFSVVGGGDSVAAVTRLGLADRFTHLSTGGGASLEFLSGVELPGLLALGEATGASPGRGGAA
jgi:phosphoglycerate kinase